MDDGVEASEDDTHGVAKLLYTKQMYIYCAFSSEIQRFEKRFL